MSDGKRIQYVDIYRGIGILLMVLGHVGIWGTYDYWIHAFHMPMFFFIAGYLYHEHADYLIYILSKARSLLVPYVCYGLLAYAVYLMLQLGDAVSPLIHLFTINTTGVALAGAIWFLTALLWVYVIYLAIDRAPFASWLKTVICYTLAIIGCLETRIIPLRLPLSLGPALVGIGLFHTARLMRDSSGRIHRLLMISSPIKLVVWIIVDTILIYASPEINMRTGSYPNIPMFWINAISSCLLLLNICREYCSRTESNRFLQLLNREIEYIGRNSIIYVCLNLLILYLLDYAWGISGYGLAVRSIIKLTRVLIALVSMRLWSELVNRTWLRVTIGKW